MSEFTEFFPNRWPGLIIVWPCENTLPDSNYFLECDGSLVSISSYGNLFDIVGTTYGGDGVTNFALPNYTGYYLRGREEGVYDIGYTENDGINEHTHALNYIVWMSNIGGFGAYPNQGSAGPGIMYFCSNAYGPSNQPIGISRNTIGGNVDLEDINSGVPDNSQLHSNFQEGAGNFFTVPERLKMIRPKTMYVKYYISY